MMESRLNSACVATKNDFTTSVDITGNFSSVILVALSYISYTAAFTCQLAKG